MLLPDPAAVVGGQVDWEMLAEACEGEGWLRMDLDGRWLQINLRTDRLERDWSVEPLRKLKRDWSGRRGRRGRRGRDAGR